jgi:ABC-type sulfate/molybdate transport systems ATPase subunit
VALEVQIEKRLPGFSLRVSFGAGEAPVGILGASGVGKTMTLRAIAGLEPHVRGRIVLDGRVLLDSSRNIAVPSRARRIGLVFQHYALFPHLSVAENIAFGLRHLETRERQQRIAGQVAAMHLAGLERRHPAALSGGQQQRVALARALAPEPAALLLDEPFSALDTHLRSQMERQLRETLGRFGRVALLVSHNLEEIYRLCGEIVVLDRGTVIAHGPREEIFRRPPDRATARLTGCKNFSRARAVDDHQVEALDWGCTLRVAEEVPRAVGHVAIRAHHIVVGPPREESAEPPGNRFPCWLAAATEGPFRVTLYLRLARPPADPSDYHLQVEVTREQWAEFKDHALPWSLRLAPERLMLLPD